MQLALIIQIILIINIRKWILERIRSTMSSLIIIIEIAIIKVIVHISIAIEIIIIKVIVNIIIEIEIIIIEVII